MSLSLMHQSIDQTYDQNESDGHVEIENFLNVEIAEPDSEPIVSKSLMCLKCDYVAPNKQSLSHHKKTHRECEKCSKKYQGLNSIRDYRNHVKKCGIVIQFQCPYCPKIFAQNSRLTKHLKVCKNKCKFCDKSFSSPNELKSHLICIHEK